MGRRITIGGEEDDVHPQAAAWLGLTLHPADEGLASLLGEGALSMGGSLLGG